MGKKRTSRKDRIFEPVNKNARICAGVFVSSVSFDQFLRLRRVNPRPAKPSANKPSVAGSGTFTESSMLNESPALTAVNPIASVIEYSALKDTGIVETCPIVVSPVTEASISGQPPSGVSQKVRVSVSPGLKSGPVKVLTRFIGPLDITQFR
jgi:hypothetical protein